MCFCLFINDHQQTILELNFFLLILLIIPIHYGNFSVVSGLNKGSIMKTGIFSTGKIECNDKNSTSMKIRKYIDT